MSEQIIIADPQPLKRLILEDDWSVVMIAATHGEGHRPYLVGDLVGTTKTRITGYVIELDRSQGFALTNGSEDGSVYQLGNQRVGEPDLNQLLALAKTIAAWRGVNS